MKGMKIYGSFNADSYSPKLHRLANGNTKI